MFLIILLSFLSACSRQEPTQPKKESVKLAPTITAYKNEHADFDLCFKQGHVFKKIEESTERISDGYCTILEEAPLTVSVQKTGTIALPSGHIVACDPGLIGVENLEPFTRSVTPGTYPVLLSVPKGDRPLASKIVFNDNKIVRWELALRPRWSMLPRDPDAKIGYIVESGTGCFIDAAALALMDKKQNQDLWRSVVHRFFENTKDGERTHKWVNAPIDKKPGSPNIVAFVSGVGDGAYASWWGLDQHNKPVALVTDFDMLYTDVEASLTFTHIQDKFGHPIDHPFLTRYGKKIVVWPGPDGGEKTIRIDSVGFLSPSFYDSKGNVIELANRRYLKSPSGTFSEVLTFRDKLDPTVKLRLVFTEYGPHRH